MLGQSSGPPGVGAVRKSVYGRHRKVSAFVGGNLREREDLRSQYCTEPGHHCRCRVHPQLSAECRRRDRATCEDALRLIDKFILPQLDSQRGNPSFSKMKADLAKFQDGFEPSTTPAAGGGLDAARKVRTEVAPAEAAAAPNAPLAPTESAGSDGRPGALHHLGGILTPNFRCAILNGFQVRSRLYRSRCLDFRSHVQVLAAMYRIRFISSCRRSRSSTLRAFVF